MFIQTAFIFSSVVRRLVCRCSGLRLLALHRFPAFLASSHFSVSASSYCFCSAAPPRWRCAFCRRLKLHVSTTENPFISPMLIQTAFNFSSVVQRLVCRFSGLRLLALRWFVVFLASGPCVASASSYCFRSAVPPRWRCAFSRFAPVVKWEFPVLASGSNISLKPTRLRRSAYLAR